ncbi:1447_t:CDS:2 [Entrophospora sp. SA101]|nr:1447_t:CDS:2 [Entrophospora sp. SA101]
MASSPSRIAENHGRKGNEIFSSHVSKNNATPFVYGHSTIFKEYNDMNECSIKKYLQRNDIAMELDNNI